MIQYLQGIAFFSVFRTLVCKLAKVLFLFAVDRDHWLTSGDILCGCTAYMAELGIAILVFLAYLLSYGELREAIPAN